MSLCGSRRAKGANPIPKSWGPAVPRRETDPKRIKLYVPRGSPCVGVQFTFSHVWLLLSSWGTHSRGVGVMWEQL